VIPEGVTAETTCEGLARRWQIAPQLAARILLLHRLLPTSLQIISGYRTAAEQAAAGVFAARDEDSTHRSCPATGADLWLPLIRIERTFGGLLGSALALAQVRIFGVAVGKVGLRWGGGSRVVAGFPLDWNHVDLGPRA